MGTWPDGSSAPACAQDTGCLILSGVPSVFLLPAQARKGRGNDKNSPQTVH